MSTERCFLFPQVVVHEAVLDVAESGTEAAAATGFKIIPLNAKFYFMKMYFNNPFLIIIISGRNTHIAFFMAKVTNPR